MKGFHGGRGGRESGGFGKAGYGKSKGRRPGGFERGGFGGFGRPTPEARSSGGFNKGAPGGKWRPQMHDAVCAKCGQRCEVPFKPFPSKPVYCSACFQKADPKRPTNMAEELNQINDKLDKILNALHLG